MTIDERYKILFEPVKIGPVVAPNSFYQVPHCNGMGFRDVSGMVALRAIKAEGGWGIVCTEQVEIHHTSEIDPDAVPFERELTASAAEPDWNTFWKE